MQHIDLVIIGGGPAGLAAALAARNQGIQDILILEREYRLGGILNQCIHNGFGLHFFKEELTGPEYANRFIQQVKSHGICYHSDTMVIDLNQDKMVTAVNKTDGLFTIQAKAIILAMGCRERPRGALNIPGSRCAGIYTAGTAQRFVNMEGMLPGKNVVILGSGDIGLIMARRMTLEGAHVNAVVELMPYSAGLTRNIVQCLYDFNISLKLSHTVTRIIGKDRVEGVYIAPVDDNKKPITDMQEFIACDTLLLSVGLLPENELSKRAAVRLSPITGGAIVDQGRQTSVEGIFACGNVLHVHDLVDHVTEEGYIAGEAAAKYLQGLSQKANQIEVKALHGIRYIIPQTISQQYNEKDLSLHFRVKKEYRDCTLCLSIDDKKVYQQKKKIMSPGEMQTIRFPIKLLNNNMHCSQISLEIAEV